MLLQVWGSPSILFFSSLPPFPSLALFCRFLPFLYMTYHFNGFSGVIVWNMFETTYGCPLHGTVLTIIVSSMDRTDVAPNLAHVRQNGWPAGLPKSQPIYHFSRTRKLPDLHEPQ